MSAPLKMSKEEAMIAEQLIRNIWEVHSRLFDHRPVLQGHIKAFCKEFEEKRGTRDEEKLNKLKMLITDLKDKYVPETKTSLDTYLTNIDGEVKVALEMCTKIEKKESNIEVGFLALQRQQRREQWDVFMQQQFDKSAQVDFDIDTEKKKLSAEYAELEKKMEHISTLVS